MFPPFSPHVYIFMYKIHILKKERRREDLEESGSLSTTLFRSTSPFHRAENHPLARVEPTWPPLLAALHARDSRETCQKPPFTRTVFQRLVRLAVDASRTSRKRKQEGGRCSKASRGRRPVRKRPSSLKYVPAGGNYAFNYLNE